eukprot:TRINITY_DN16798_c0_g1_i2.p1 TRINITY_DN16798_c0_g1~~TRINITY_DN16798_c0_g1_i2.p1  ORF type:complete len:104 (+),score=24.23 TRINITY_DN16798_c0_g1_i2:236-547(+)
MASIPLQQYLSELNLVQYNQISLLKNTRIGIDGLTWLRKISPIEPFQPAMGGVPLQAVVSTQSTGIVELDITPFFVSLPVQRGLHRGVWIISQLDKHQAYCIQ